MSLDTITLEEFEKRLDTSNERMRHELSEIEERVRQLKALNERKEAFGKRLDQILAEMEQEENEIAAAEKKLRLLNAARPKRKTASKL